MKLKSKIRAACQPFGASVCAGALLLIASGAQAQNLFEADYGSGNIYEFTPGGVQSTFASGLFEPIGLAFNSAGDLFEADEISGNINEITPGDGAVPVADGLDAPTGLAFQPVPEPSALGLLAFGVAALLVRHRRRLSV